MAVNTTKRQKPIDKYLYMSADADSTSKLSMLKRLTVSDMVKYNNVIWDRGLIQSNDVVSRRDEVDQLAVDGRIYLVGSWSHNINPKYTSANDITTLDQFLEVRSALSARECRFVERRLHRTLPLETLLNDPRIKNEIYFSIFSIQRPDITKEIFDSLDLISTTDKITTHWIIDLIPVEVMMQIPSVRWERTYIGRRSSLAFETMLAFDEWGIGPNQHNHANQWSSYDCSRNIPLSAALFWNPSFVKYQWCREGFSQNPTLTLEFMDLVDHYLPSTNLVTISDHLLANGERSDSSNNEIETVWLWDQISENIALSEILPTLHLLRQVGDKESPGWSVKYLLKRSVDDIEMLFAAIYSIRHTQPYYEKILRTLFVRLKPSTMFRYAKLNFVDDINIPKILNMNPVVTLGDLYALFNVRQRELWRLISSVTLFRSSKSRMVDDIEIEIQSRM
jgi:hypothetical protein